jgi:nucleoside-diphosphate-sugar epimerase
MRVLAGAGGAIGRRLVPQLIAHGHHVFRIDDPDGEDRRLRAFGADALVMDGLDPASVGGRSERSGSR